MDEKVINEVAKIIEEWNPLEEMSETISDLDGYKAEAIDILSTYQIIFKGNMEKAIKEILEQAFDIKIDSQKAAEAADRIKSVLKDHK